MVADLHDVDLYELLGILATASTQEVKKAYRKKALTCHPDKNPDNPRAAELFHELSRALEVLTDESARAAYDKVLNAKKAAKLRNRLLDSKRRKLKEDLEARERLAEESAKKGRTDEEKLQAEIERLRKEGSKQLEEEQEYIRQQIIEERLKAGKTENEDSSAQKRIRVRWEAVKSDPNNGGYDSEVLHRIFSKYGDIVALVVSLKKKGSALVEFKTKEAATMALELERGLASNPLKIESLEAAKSQKATLNMSKGPKLADLNTDCKSPNESGIFPSMKKTVPSRTSGLSSFSFSPDALEDAGQCLDSDYESVVLHRMRQAEERKRLIEEMMKEDKEVVTKD